MNNLDLLSKLDQLIIGHDRTKKVLINALNRSYSRYYKKIVMGEQTNLNPTRTLIIGPSGTGKTHLVSTICHLTRTPWARIDATKFGPLGEKSSNVGMIMDMVTQKIKDYCKRDPVEYRSFDGTKNRFVLFIDEIDKISTKNEAWVNFSKQIQAQYLTLLDDFNSGISFILAGAFSELHPHTHKKKEIGFLQEQGSEPTSTGIITSDDIINYGFSPEFVGRLTHITQLDRFTKKNYMYIIDSELTKKNEELQELGAQELIMDNDAREALAEEAERSGQGFRYVTRVLYEKALELEFGGLGLEPYILV